MLDPIHAKLTAWNEEADRFRQAALAARRGEMPTSLVVEAVEEAHDDLLALLDGIEQALDRLSAGNPRYADLLQVQMTAIALLESVGNSHDILDGVMTDKMIAPRRIPHDVPVAIAAVAS